MTEPIDRVRLEQIARWMMRLGLPRHAAALRAAIAWMDEARPAVDSLRQVLPDSIHEDKKCWEWCWDELDGEAQDAVKAAREVAAEWLARWPAKEDKP